MTDSRKPWVRRAVLMEMVIVIENLRCCEQLSGPWVHPVARSLP